MPNETRKRTQSQPLRKTAYIPKALISHKSLSHQAFRIACVMLAHKESCEPTIAGAAILARVGRDGTRSARRALIETGVCTPAGRISYSYRKVREQYARVTPATILREDLYDADLRVFACLSGYADRAGFAFPKYSTLSTQASVSPRQVRRSMSALDKLGLVSEQRRTWKPSWKFVNEPSLFNDLEAPDLPEETRQEDLSLALKRVGRPAASSNSPLTERKLNYAHQTLVARNLLFLVRTQSTDRKNQQSDPAGQAGAFGPSFPGRASSSTPASSASQKPSQEGASCLIKRQAPYLAMPLAVPADKRPLTSNSSGARPVRPVWPVRDRQGARVAQDPPVGVLDYPEIKQDQGEDPLPRFRSPPLPSLQFRRIGAARKQIRRITLQQPSRLALTAWDCSTFRAIEAGALDPRRTDLARGKLLGRLWLTTDWTETYSYETGAGKDQSMSQRGHGLFKLGKLGGPGSRDSVQPQPEIMTNDQTDILCLLAAELRKRFGDEVNPRLPRSLTGKQRGQLKKAIIERFGEDQITKMIRVLVWDWEEVRVGFWPKTPMVPMPTVDHLVTFCDVLVQFVDSGVPSTDPARRGRAGYAERYLTPGGPSERGGEPPAAPHGFSLDSL